MIGALEKVAERAWSGSLDRGDRRTCPQPGYPKR